MKITLPIYVQKLSATAAHIVHPLFFAQPEARDENLNRAITKLAKELRRACDALGRDRRHDELSRYGFCPDTDDRLLKLTLDLSDRKAQCRFLVVAFESLGRKLAFTPSVPDLWFEIDRGETMIDRAEEVLTAYFRDKQKQDGANALRPESLSVYLFGDADKILRFDMNEYSSVYAVARLVGTFDQLEGLLASAIRRQPFAVVLLDEIEKAHPDVFNLLLQVMGDGRLTDALGRTVDFTNAILILTSNLGVREAASGLGFLQDAARESQVYVQAAEKFFKPEFFNRLDRVVPFAKLRREDVREIARGLIQNVFARDGLVRRRCILEAERSVDSPRYERVQRTGRGRAFDYRRAGRAERDHQASSPTAVRRRAVG